MLDVASEILGKVAAEVGCDCERTYVHVGAVAWDGCDQLVLSVTGMRTGVPGGVATGLPTGPVCGPVTIQAVLSRVWCVPVGTGTTPPTAGELDRAGAAAVDEADRLWAAVADALASVDCSGRIVGANAVGPEGGLVGWSIIIEWTR